jgi:hypothetical protein
MASDPHKEASVPAGYWTTEQAATWAKVTPGRMRVILADVDPADRQTGRGGQHVYKISAVKAALAKMPGQGARSDLR